MLNPCILHYLQFLLTWNKISTAGVFSWSEASIFCHRGSEPDLEGEDGGKEKREWSMEMGVAGVELLMAPDFTCSTAASIDAM